MWNQGEFNVLFPSRDNLLSFFWLTLACVLLLCIVFLMSALACRKLKMHKWFLLSCRWFVSFVRIQWVQYGWRIHSVSRRLCITFIIPGRRKERGLCLSVLHWRVLGQERHSTCVWPDLCLCLCVLQRTRATQIIPCTVSQLMSASQADEAFKVGDVEVAQVSRSMTAGREHDYSGNALRDIDKTQ